MSRGEQDQRFTERYSELKEFIEQTGRRPRAESKDAAEAALGRWTTTQQTLRNAGQLAADRLRLLEELGDALAPRQTYADRIAELAEFIRDNGRRPLFGSVNASERSLAAWLNFQVIARNKGELSAERSDLLEPLVAADSTRRIRPIAEWVADLATFHNEHGRMPLSTREEERGLALWLINKRMSFKDGTMPQEQIDALSTVPGALATRKNANPDERLLEAQEWCAQHGYIPRASFTDTDALTADEEKERSIGAWMRNHARDSSRTYEPTEYSERRQSILDLYEKYPSRTEFNEIVTRDRVRKALERADYIPSSTEDSQTHGWLANARRLRAEGGQLSPETLEVLALADSLRPHADHKRNARLDELRAFVQANGRMPGFAKLAPKEEKNLAFWVKRRLDGSRTSGGADINEQINELIAECAREAAAAKDVEPVKKRQANPALESAECADVMAALTAAGHLPESASPAYAWLVKHRKLRSAGTFISDEVSHVLAYADTLKSAREVRHERRLVEYEDFLKRSGRPPTPGGEKTEASLANWASGVLRGVVNAGPDIESALRRLAKDSTRNTGRDIGETSNWSRHGWDAVLDSYAKGKRLASLYDDEPSRRFLDRLRETVTAEHEQSRADAVAGEIRSLRQLIQDDVDRGLVHGHLSPESIRRSMVLDHRLHWQHDLAMDVYQEVLWEASILVDFPMTCYSPYLDYGVLAVYGMLNGLTADSVQPDSHDEEIVVEDLDRFLSDFSASSRQCILKSVLGALRQLSHASGRQLYAAKYDVGREQLREICEVPSFLDWPAPAQTVSQLLGKGSWNGALVHLGLPRILQSLNWQGSDFIGAAVEFAETLSEREPAPVTEFAYDDWVKLEVVRGKERPSLLSMQVEFGTVEDALRLVGESTDLTREDTDTFEDEWHRVHELLSETVSEAPAGARVDVRVVEEGEALEVPLFASATITADGAECALASALVVGTERWPQDVKRMLELGWSSSEDRRDVWLKSVSRADIASTLIAGLRECRGVTRPQQLRWSKESSDGRKTLTEHRPENAPQREEQHLVPDGSSEDLQWADAVQALTDELVWLKDDDFLSVAYGDGTRQYCAPYAQATPHESGLSLELVSEEFLSAEVWPLNPGFLLAAGWKAPSDENPNWHTVNVPREAAAKKLLDGLRFGRECPDAELLRWHLAVFPPQNEGPDDLDDAEAEVEDPPQVSSPGGGHDDSLQTTQLPSSERHNEGKGGIIEFLKARISEDELQAHQVLELIPGGVFWKAFLMEAWAAYSDGGRAADSAFKYMRKLSPDHILAECETKRKIIAHFERIACGSESSGDQHLEKLLFILAEPYAAHHEYREQWRP